MDERMEREESSRGTDYAIRRKPHFFKLITSPSLKSGKLRIPPKFTNQYGRTLKSRVILLKVPTGAIWEVEIVKQRDDNFWMRKGWPEFAEHYSIGHGHFLVFRYEGNSLFCIIIFDMTCTEIEYPRVAMSRRSEVSAGGAPHLRLNHQEEQLQNLTRIESGNNFDIQQQSDQERVSNVKTTCDDHTCFSITVKPSHVSQRFCMTIPVRHFNKYLKNQEKRVVYLRGVDGRTWSVKYYVHIWHGKIRAQFSPDFKGFSAHHNLKAGDVCYFELVKLAPPRYMVSVTHARRRG